MGGGDNTDRHLTDPPQFQNHQGDGIAVAYEEPIAAAAAAYAPHVHHQLETEMAQVQSEGVTHSPVTSRW